MPIHRSHNVRFYFLYLGNFCFFAQRLARQATWAKIWRFPWPLPKEFDCFLSRQAKARFGTRSHVNTNSEHILPFPKDFIVFLKVAPRHAMAVLPRGPKFEDFLDTSLRKSMIFENMWAHVTSRSFTSYAPYVTNRYNLSSLYFFGALWCKYVLFVKLVFLGIVFRRDAR